MRAWKIIKRLVLVIVLVALAYGIHYAWVSFPIISGYGAKNLCSCRFAAGRTEKSVREDELADAPLNLGSFTVDEKDSSVTGTVAGLAKRKAVYRAGLGCTLVNDVSEQQLRAQHFTTATPPPVNQDSIPWPMGDRLKDSLPPGIDTVLLKQAIQGAFKETDPKKKIATRAVVVLYDGRLVAEQYAPGFDRHSPMLGWSMSKSITGTLAAILVKQGKLKVEAPAPVPEWSDPADPRHAITLQNLLQQTSGLDFEENYAKASTATNMLFKKGDMGAYVAGLPLKYKPGSLFYYSSGNSNVLSRIIRQTVGEQDYHRFPATALFYKIGMYSALPEPDASGTFVGSSYTYATARDWARFGLLYYNDGVWNGERILPEGWVKQASTPVVTPAGPQEYGYQLWLDKLNADKPLQAGVPADVFYADGYGGQEVYIIPSKKLVVVRLGLHVCDMESLLHGVMNAIR
ncbi:MAG TPA: serine hydrolase [Chitinophagaceae bacterium]|nr:serine hydrolase [Chitinophagaceae bacterium]